MSLRSWTVSAFKHQQPDRKQAIARHKRRAESEHRRKVREVIFERYAVCRACQGRRRDECAGLPDQLHHDPKLSQTRGLPAEERSNTRVCVRLCAACRADAEARRIVPQFMDPDERFNGRVRWVKSEK